MAATATINIRIEEDLKEQAQNVLKRNGIGTSEAIRRLFQELANTQELPAFLQEETSEVEKEIQERRSLLRSMVGILEKPVTKQEIREERLAKPYPEEVCQ